MPASAQKAFDPAPVIRLAAERGLSRDPYWRTLLHYKPTLFGGSESLVDDPRFFFAKEGKKNPEAELGATITAFFSPVEEGKKHPTAKFPARYAWIRQQLGLETSAFPYDGDAEFLNLKAKGKFAGVSLVFPAGYMNTPASMFGHTFLLIEAKGGSRLLSHSVNYGAVTEDTFGPFYAFKGLIGSYRGYYSFLPYYQKIREYGDIDMRDMWEYELNFSDAELDRILRHIVEMEDIYSDYFFITENCSYNLLFLIEAAKPETKATSALGLAAEPIDTVKFFDRSGLVKKRLYRPSLYAKIQYQASALSSGQNAFILDVCYGKKEASAFPFAAIEDEKKAAIWELAVDYLKFLATQGKVSEAEYRKRFLSILSARKNFGKIDALKGLVEPEPPEASHGSRKIAFDTSADNRGIYSEAAFRLTAHDALDRDAGYTRNSQLVVGQFSVRWRYAESEFSFRKLDIVDLISLPKSDAFFLNPCFQVTTGFTMNPDGAEAEVFSYRFRGAAGLSAAPFPWVQMYAFLGSDSYISTSYEYGVDLQLGGEAGFIISAGPWRSRISATLHRTLFAPIHTRFSLNAEEGIALGKDISLIGHYAWKGDYETARHEYGLAASFFF